MKKILFFIMISSILINPAFSQKQGSNDDLITEKHLSAFKFRNIGPALTSGRISDIAIDPNNENTWFITAGSGGVWKTINAGTTWEPVFDQQSSYSIGCVTIDPHNSHTIWVGTGENIGGRHVGYGDGIYRSDDGGKSWKNMGLKESQHISKIIVHPEDPDIIMVAVQGPLWSKGGDRGFYISEDGGKNWKKTLGDDIWTGVTDIVMDPRYPDLIYAATWQRGRTVATYVGGGPGTGIHKSSDGGHSWKELKSGLPTSNMGKIGLAISPQKPDIIYAAIELDRRSGGVYKSENRGESWVKQSDAVAGATGPHYYQELYACPHNFDKIYLVDVRIQVSEDGGKNFKRLNEKNKHSDNHAIAFRMDDPDYLLVGTDGGLYESFDDAKNWRYMPNLPLTQFYKVAVDDSEPFYNIYGGTQDNGTQGGPSRTPYRKGISNADWFMNLFADGHQPATEPGNPNIVYSETQEGGLNRVDRKTGEIINIQPQPARGEKYERFNWDSPILVSPHKPTTIYFASQRVWKSDNRGDSWEAISGDLTRDQERLTLPVMDKTWSWDSPWDLEAMSIYNTITSLSESPVKEGLIYAGTDDGLIHVTDDGGKNWRKIEVGTLPDLPETAFVNDIKADLFDENTVYAVFDNHKYGDLNPYIYKSNNKGKSWTSIVSNLPKKTLLWRVVQDHIKPHLMFIGTEFGIYTTFDAGKKWIKLSGGVPTISFRDLVIQKRENDLVGASFGRGFFVLDDYSPLRQFVGGTLEKEAALLPMRDAVIFNQRASQTFGGKGSQGASFYIADNPPYGAVFTYYLTKDYLTKKSQRKKTEKELQKENNDILFPGWDELDAELAESEPVVFLTVLDSNNNVARRIKAKSGKGLHRITWDLRYPRVGAITMSNPEVHKEFKTQGGLHAAPGEYSAFLSKLIEGNIEVISDTILFKIRRIEDATLRGNTPEEIMVFGKEVNDLLIANTALNTKLKNASKKLKAMKSALVVSNNMDDDLYKKIHELEKEITTIESQLYGSKSKKEVGQKNDPTLTGRLWYAMGGTNTSYGPTQTQKESLSIAQEEFVAMKKDVEKIINEEIPAVEKMVIESGIPWIEGQSIPE